jgi:hypothetical protein
MEVVNIRVVGFKTVDFGQSGGFTALPDEIRKVRYCPRLSGGGRTAEYNDLLLHIPSVNTPA